MDLRMKLKMAENIIISNPENLEKKKKQISKESKHVSNVLRIRNFLRKSCPNA